MRLLILPDSPYDPFVLILPNRSCVTVSLRNTRMTFLSKFPQIGHVSLYPSVTPHDLSAQILPNRSCVTYFPASCGSDVLCSPDTHSNAASIRTLCLPTFPWLLPDTPFQHSIPTPTTQHPDTLCSPDTHSDALQHSHTHFHTLIYRTPIIENIFLCMLKSIL